MSKAEQRLRWAAREQAAGYRRAAARRSPESLALVRRQLAVGPLGHALKLDTLPGVVWARVTDHGAPGVVMTRAAGYVEVWGGKPDEVLATVERERPAGVILVARWRPAGWWVRLKARARWWLYRIAGHRRGRR